MDRRELGKRILCLGIWRIFMARLGRMQGLFHGLYIDYFMLLMRRGQNILSKFHLLNCTMRSYGIYWELTMTRKSNYLKIPRKRSSFREWRRVSSTMPKKASND